MDQSFDLIVIGAGPGGYVAAIRAAQLGMKVACVEKQYLGGTCLNVGCIPSKALLDSSERYHEAVHAFARHGIKTTGVELDLPAMLKRKDQVVAQLTGGVGMLFRKNKVEHVKGTARLVAPNTVEVNEPGTTLQAPRILIATGSVPAAVPALPFDGKHIVSSTEALSLPQVPARLIVIGAGYIGVELGSVWRRLGSEVLVIEFLDRALPLSDREMAGLLQKALEKLGIRFQFNTAAESASVADGVVKLGWKSGEKSGFEEADVVLVAVGRKPASVGLGLEELGVAAELGRGALEGLARAHRRAVEEHQKGLVLEKVGISGSKAVGLHTRRQLQHGQQLFHRPFLRADQVLAVEVHAQLSLDSHDHSALWGV